MRERLGLRAGARLLAAALGIGLLGCGPAAEEVEQGSLLVHVPCVISAPMLEVAAVYSASHPRVEVRTETAKPLAQLAEAGRGDAGGSVIVTMGDREMEWLVSVGAVDAADVRTVAVNTYPLTVIAAAEGAPGANELSDLAGPTVKRIYVEDPERSSLGDRATQALKELGLWDDVAAKVVRPDPNAMVLGEVIAGKADAAVIFEDCIFAEGSTGRSVPKTLRVIGRIPADAYSPIPYQAAALADTPDREEAQAFVDFLVSPPGREALAAVGLNVKAE
jgi:molybdate transport system substrate-binding protein